MFDSRSKFVKIFGYIIIGFFTLIIIISFGMPDFLSRIGMDQNIVAVVNGEKLQYLDYLKYRDNFARRLKNANSKEIQRYILNLYIRYRLQLQMAKEYEIKVSKESVKRYIRNIPAFKNEKGKFNIDYLKRYMNYYHYNLSGFNSMIMEELIINKMMEMINVTTGVSPEEVNNEYIIQKSKIQIKYCFLSTKDLKKRYKKRISVSDKEIDEEMKKNRGEVKDPKTDRKRIKKKLENKKFQDIKKKLIDTINDLAVKNKSFSTAATRLGGKVLTSKVFRIGEPVKENSKKGKIIHSINNSTIFRDECLLLDSGKTSKVINSFEGLYIFTPLKKIISLKKPSPLDFDRIQRKLESEKSNAIYSSIMSSYSDKSIIIKNPKFN
ncbi:MAG: SurA N-terminal domain-containing protein [Spirochaetota bacterium]|nr:SurA N-terminal domain-containing protein [Spirochaetota bacterium]